MKNQARRSFLTAFLSAFLCFTVFWMATFLFFKPTAASSTLSSQNKELTSHVYLPKEEDCMTLLLYSDTLSSDLFFLLCFDPVRGNIFIASFPQKLVLSLDGVSEPMKKIYESSGIGGLKSAIAQTFFIPVERYVKVNLKQLPFLLDSFSATRATLTQDLPVQIHDTQIILKKGVQELNSHQLITWIRSETPSLPLQKSLFLSKTLANCINQHRSLLESNQSEKLFSAVVNHCDSDLHYSDYDSRKQAASFLGSVCPDPAKAVELHFVRNPDATLSLTQTSLENLQQCFGCNAS